MKTIWLKLENTRIIDIAEGGEILSDYIKVELESYPNDLMTRSYEFIDGQIIENAEYRKEFEDSIVEQEQENDEIE